MLGGFRYSYDQHLLVMIVLTDQSVSSGLKPPTRWTLFEAPLHFPVLRPQEPAAKKQKTMPAMSGSVGLPKQRLNH